MQQFNFRQFKRNMRNGADGRVIFHGLTEISDGVITSGGKLAYADNGVDIQTQINSVVADVAAIPIHSHVQEQVCFIDSKRDDDYKENGSEELPYKTLSAAVAAKLGDSETSFVSFRLASGNYDGAISVDKPAQNQSFELIGSGSQNCFIRGAATWSGSTGSVLYFRDFWDITIKGVSVTLGKYGIYLRKCRNVKIQDCEFKYLGSAGTENRHDLSATMAEQAAYWASSDTSDGGTMRVRDCDDVQLHNLSTSYCLRGYRIQDCRRGTITSCRGYKLLESCFYLASNSYDGTAQYGCKNFYISNCVADTIAHTGVLIIGAIQTLCRVSHVLTVQRLLLTVSTHRTCV